MCLSFLHAVVGERVYILCFTYLLAYLARPVRRCHVILVRRRDDDVRRRRRRRTYITGFSVTFLCKCLYVFLTRCCYTVNEFIYYVSRIYLLT